MEKVYEEFFNKNRTLYSLDGELDPKLYQDLTERFASQIKNIEWNIICDSYVAVEDADFRENYILRLNHLAYWWHAQRKEAYWKAHPLFDIASKNENIKIYVSKKRIEPHFFIGKENNDLLVEEVHQELQESIPRVYLNSDIACGGYLRFWNDLIKNCTLWDKNKVSVDFKPRTIFEQENKVLEELNQEDKVTILD